MRRRLARPLPLERFRVLAGVKKNDHVVDKWDAIRLETHLVRTENIFEALKFVSVIHALFLDDCALRGPELDSAF